MMIYQDPFGIMMGGSTGIYISGPFLAEAGVQGIVGKRMGRRL